jgi:single-strand DNA-binding protein
MACFNKVIIVGNLTRDPQLSYLPSQTPVVEFGLASNRRWRGQNGEHREETCFIDCRCFGKQAETFNQYMTKGQQVLIEGRLSFDMWEDKEGQKRSKHRITVERFVFMGAPRGQGQPGPGAPRQAAPPAPAEPPPPEMDYQPEPPPSGEDIPF